MSAEEVNNSHLSNIWGWRGVHVVNALGKVTYSEGVTDDTYDKTSLNKCHNVCNIYNAIGSVSVVDMTICISYYPHPILFPCQQTHTQRIVDPDTD